MSTPQFNAAPAVRTARRVALVAAAALLVAACGAASTSTGTQPAGRAAASGADAGGGGGDATVGSGEAAGVRYQNARFHYRVDAPGTMQESADGSASARRGEERLALNVVTGSAAADLKSYATSDIQRVEGSSAKYHLMQSLSAVTISGHAGLKVVYSWTDGTNPVTGKAEDLVTVRYYIPRDAATAAVLAYAISAAQYDPQGADDVASTFAWT